MSLSVDNGVSRFETLVRTAVDSSGVVLKSFIIDSGSCRLTEVSSTLLGEIISRKMRFEV